MSISWRFCLLLNLYWLLWQARFWLLEGRLARSQQNPAKEVLIHTLASVIIPGAFSSSSSTMSLIILPLLPCVLWFCLWGNVLWNFIHGDDWCVPSKIWVFFCQLLGGASNWESLYSKFIDWVILEKPIEWNLVWKPALRSA